MSTHCSLRRDCQDARSETGQRVAMDSDRHSSRARCLRSSCRRTPLLEDRTAPIRLDLQAGPAPFNDRSFRRCAAEGSAVVLHRERVSASRTAPRRSVSAQSRAQSVPADALSLRPCRRRHRGPIFGRERRERLASGPREHHHVPVPQLRLEPERRFLLDRHESMHFPP